MPDRYPGVPVGDVVGGVVGGAAFVFALACFATFIRRRKAQNRACYPQTLEQGGEPLCSHDSLSPVANHSDTEGPHNAQSTEGSAPGSETLSSEINSTIDTRPDYDTLLREMRRMKRDIRVLRKVQTVACDTPEPTRVIAVALGPPIDGGVEAELRSDMAVLRAELTRLLAETEELRDLPPAYQ